MDGTVFLDTNVLVYAYGGQNEAKQTSAEALLRATAGNAVISTQVVNEFCNVMLTKKGVLIKPDDLKVILRDVLEPMLQPMSYIEGCYRAVELFSAHSLSFYDALVVQAAIDLGCTTLYSEDLQDGQKFGSLTVKNPFK